MYVRFTTNMKEYDLFGSPSGDKLVTAVPPRIALLAATTDKHDSTLVFGSNPADSSPRPHLSYPRLYLFHAVVVAVPGLDETKKAG